MGHQTRGVNLKMSFHPSISDIRVKELAEMCSSEGRRGPAYVRGFETCFILRGRKIMEPFGPYRIYSESCFILHPASTVTGSWPVLSVLCKPYSSSLPPPEKLQANSRYHVISSISISVCVSYVANITIIRSYLKILTIISSCHPRLVDVQTSYCFICHFQIQIRIQLKTYCQPSGFKQESECYDQTFLNSWFRWGNGLVWGLLGDRKQRN